MSKRSKLSKRQKRLQLGSQKQPKSEPENAQLSSKNKTWKRIAVFDKYEDAAAHKVKILDGAEDVSELEVKIKRCGPEGSQFQVKLWAAPSLRLNKKRKKDNNRE